MIRDLRVFFFFSSQAVCQYCPQCSICCSGCWERRWRALLELRVDSWYQASCRPCALFSPLLWAELRRVVGPGLNCWDVHCTRSWSLGIQVVLSHFNHTLSVYFSACCRSHLRNFLCFFMYCFEQIKWSLEWMRLPCWHLLPSSCCTPVLRRSLWSPCRHAASRHSEPVWSRRTLWWVKRIV